MSDDKVVFDIETKKSFDDVGSRDNHHLLGVSVVGAYSYKDDKFHVFEENELESLFDLFKNASQIIGFNIIDFDIPVLEPYTSLKLYELPLLDMMDDVERGVGFRVGLNNLAGATLGISKSADGLQALEWFKQGQIEKVKKYCLDDVRITRNLFEHGRIHGHILAKLRQSPEPISISVRWGDESGVDIRAILQEAFNNRKQVEIEYITKSPTDSNFVNKRIVDIYSINKDGFEGYCHLRQGKRVFKINRVKSAVLTDKSYVIVEDVQASLL